MKTLLIVLAILYAAFLFVLGVLFAPPMEAGQLTHIWKGNPIVKYHGGCGYGGWRCGTWNPAPQCADHEHAPDWCGYAVPDLQQGECVEFGDESLAMWAAVFYTGRGWAHPLPVLVVEEPDECALIRRTNGTVIGG